MPRGQREDARGPGVEGYGRLRWGGTDLQDVLDQVSAHAGKEESAQEGIDPNLAGPRHLGEEGNNARAQLAQVARKFIGPRQIMKLAAAGENIEAELGKRVDELVESCPDQSCGLLRIEA